MMRVLALVLVTSASLLIGCGFDPGPVADGEDITPDPLKKRVLAGPPQAALPVGSLAPEIEGEDIDGVPFKLSDYRGKVVVLDFWGDW